MTQDPLEQQLLAAADTARPPRSVVDDVMSRLPVSPPFHRPTWTWRRYLPFGITAAAILLLAVTLPFLTSGASITLADVKAALADKTWVHIRNDDGQAQEEWINPTTGISYVKSSDGSIDYYNNAANRRLSYSHRDALITETTVYMRNHTPPTFKPKTLWEYLVAPYEAATTRPLNDPYSAEKFSDTLDGRTTTRFDIYRPDALGQRMLMRQLWVDNQTHLPLRDRSHLQFGEIQNARQWSTGTYDFPPTGPDSLYALGVPKNTPIQTLADRKFTPEIQKIFDAIDAAYKAFPKNYRAIIWSEPRANSEDFTADLIYHQGIKIRQFEYFSAAPSIAEPINSAHILQWCASQRLFESQLFLGELQYDQDSPKFVHIMRVHGFPFLHGDRPEDLIWPLGRSKQVGPHQLLPPSPDTPPGCIGLRVGGADSRRTDYYLDPAKSYATIKVIHWQKDADHWTRGFQFLNTDYCPFGSSWVFSTRTQTASNSQRQGTTRPYKSWTIDFTPLSDADFPPDTFDAQKLITGAQVIPY